MRLGRIDILVLLWPVLICVAVFQKIGIVDTAVLISVPMIFVAIGSYLTPNFRAGARLIAFFLQMSFMLRMDKVSGYPEDLDFLLSVLIVFFALSVTLTYLFFLLRYAFKDMKFAAILLLMVAVGTGIILLPVVQLVPNVIRQLVGRTLVVQLEDHVFFTKIQLDRVYAVRVSPFRNDTLYAVEFSRGENGYVETNANVISEFRGGTKTPQYLNVDDYSICRYLETYSRCQ